MALYNYIVFTGIFEKLYIKLPSTFQQGVVAIKKIFRDPVIRSSLFSTLLIFFNTQKALSYTDFTSYGLLQKQSRFDKIHRSLYFWVSDAWASKIIIVFNWKVKIIIISHVSPTQDHSQLKFWTFTRFLCENLSTVEQTEIGGLSHPQNLWVFR